jgi:hypothetical protein
MKGQHALRVASGGRIHCTLLELVCAVGDASGSESETLATVMHLVRSGRVRLIGTLRNEGMA